MYNKQMKTKAAECILNTKVSSHILLVLEKIKPALGLYSTFISTSTSNTFFCVFFLLRAA